MINRHLGAISAGMSSVVYPPLSKIILIVNLLYSMYNDAIQKMKKDDKMYLLEQLNRLNHAVC